jgi:uncharacterized protein YebE (UPF0316 family)
MVILILCLQIFFFRILDVSLGVMRTILSVKRMPFLASMIGFFEVLVWFLIVKNALSTDVGGIFVALAYASGFATGTYIGGMLAKRFIKTKINVQIITSSKNENILNEIRAHGFPATVLEARGNTEEKRQRYFIFIEIKSSNFNKLKELVLALDDRSFMFVNELTNSVNGVFYNRKIK